MVKPTKTANALAECYQWHDGLDPEHIFDGEKELITQLRQNVPQLERETDKFIAIFLFGRRHDLKETTKLLQCFYKKKAQYEQVWGGNQVLTPTFKFTKTLAESGNAVPIVQPTGYRDSSGRMLRMMLLSKEEQPQDENLLFAYGFWQFYYLTVTEPLNTWRNGIAFLVDLSDFSLRSMNGGGKQRAVFKSMQDTFPMRVRSILVINGGALLSAIFAVIRLILPRKLVQRIKVIKDLGELAEQVPSQYLLPRFGGTSPEFGFAEYFEQINLNEEKLFATGVWKAPDSVVEDVVVASEKRE